MNLVIDTAAAEDVAAAYDWYASQDRQVALRFRAAFDRCVFKVLAEPHSYEVLHRGVRRALLERFPYGVFFRVAGDDVVIVACLHLRRQPTIWRARV